MVPFRLDWTEAALSGWTRMKGCLHNPGNLHRVCSTSAAAPPSRRGRGHCTRVYAADAMCKDMVNTRTQRTASEGTATITFLGAEGQEMSVNCPKVSFLLPDGLHCIARPPQTYGMSKTAPLTAKAACRTSTYLMQALTAAWSCPTPAGAASVGELTALCAVLRRLVPFRRFLMRSDGWLQSLCGASGGGQSRSQ